MKLEHHILGMLAILVVLSGLTILFFIPIVYGESSALNNKSVVIDYRSTPSLQSYKDNLTSIFGKQIYQETSHKKTGSVVMNVDGPIQTKDSYTATGVLQGVGNVTDTATFVTTHFDNGMSTSEGIGVMSTNDGKIITYTGKDVGMTDNKGVETYKGIQIFNSHFDDNLAAFDNSLGVYVYRYWPNGTTSGTIWEWK